jgi:hypothetical protein
VSRAFLVDVLGYSEANFQKLTKEEEDGGTGITGHKFIPDGAIYLTWYHGSSTRVFRDMRFLISEHPMYDLIIGAHSIHKNKILDVPNLVNDMEQGRVAYKREGPFSSFTHSHHLCFPEADTLIAPALSKLDHEASEANKVWKAAVSKANRAGMRQMQRTICWTAWRRNTMARGRYGRTN